MWGLARMPASDAALLLNAEAVFTALIAWFVFRENFDRRIAFGMALIVAGASVLSWPGEARLAWRYLRPRSLGACLAWALDNNLTRKVSLADADWIAMVKGLVAARRTPRLRSRSARRCRRCTVLGAGHHRISRLRGEPRAVRPRAAPARHRAHRRLFLDCAVFGAVLAMRSSESR